MISQYLGLLLLATHTASAYYTIQPIQEQYISRCGATVQEAQDLGCIFDLYSFTYYPPACFNEPLHKEFHAMHKQEINWYHVNGSGIPADEVMRGMNPTLETDSGYFHALHCTYEWERLVMALAEGRPLDWKVSSNGHSWHCSQNFLKRFDRRRSPPESMKGMKGTGAIMDFGQCGLSSEDMYKLGTHMPGME